MLAIIAGEGALPAALVDRLARRPLILSLQDHRPDGVEVDRVFRLEKLGSVLKQLKRDGVTEICFAGGIKRPQINPLAIDFATMPYLPTVKRALASSDDGALRAAIAVLEQAGFAVRAAQEIAPDLLPPAGIPTRARPDERAQKDATRGQAIVNAMAQGDIGQACAVWRGQALALEGIYGTDWMLQSLRQRPDGGQGGVLFKAPKPTQDRRADLPIIGPDTVEAVAEAGLTGIVLEAGGVMVLHQERVIAACDAKGLFLWVRERG
ncbi:LpxI family protein [Marinibacterium profundimaris]|uniref:Phosphatidate cytidylyltransferase n=1 Tax=Marinibacterium profundimaris TaxID=1679460 RepID=A0A225NRH7_9RHOB|nr:UDP-2,3-diacylglucosamine diphosphatase LpxI [Marinibacterium profundimaris]OWU77465.1 phosphatidate cytidylyltransferase [Marinibacterium profundimaris]